MVRLVRFLYRYVFRHPFYVLTYAWLFFQKRAVQNIHLYSDTEIKNQLRCGKSLIRFGDGEINLLLGLRNHYQKFSPLVQKMMREIISNYNSSSLYILAIPRFVTVSNIELKKIGKFNVWLPLKAVFTVMFNKDVSYFDAHSFYYDDYFENVIGPLLYSKHVVLITKKQTIAFQSSNKKIPWSKLSWIEVPESEALQQFETIHKKIENHISDIGSQEVVLLFALGPIGKYLCYLFAKTGRQSIDIGKVAEVMYTDESIEYLV